MKKFLFSICLLFVGFVSNAQDGIKDYGVVWSGVHNDTICADSMFILYDFKFYIGNNGGLYCVFDWEDIGGGIEYVHFYFKVLLKNKKYVKIAPSAPLAKPKRPSVSNHLDSCNFWTSYKRRSETEPSYWVVNASPKDVAYVELTRVKIETKGGMVYSLSGFPKYSEIRRKKQK